MIAVMVVPMAAFAAVPTSLVGGTDVAAGINVTAPGNIALGDFVVGDNFGNSDGHPGSVALTGTVGPLSTWTVAVASVVPPSMTKNGKMNSGTNYLANKLQISPNNTAWSPADTGFSYGGTGLTGNFDLYVDQVVNGGEAAGVYSITLSYTGGVTP